MVLLSIIYLIGIYGLYITGKAIYDYAQSKQRTVSASSNLQRHKLLSLLFAAAFVIIILPCIYITAQDAILLINRELGLNLSMLADYYGPNNQIIKL